MGSLHRSKMAIAIAVVGEPLVHHSRQLIDWVVDLYCECIVVIHWLKLMRLQLRWQQPEIAPTRVDWHRYAWVLLHRHLC